MSTKNLREARSGVEHSVNLRLWTERAFLEVLRSPATNLPLATRRLVENRVAQALLDGPTAIRALEQQPSPDWLHHKE